MKPPSFQDLPHDLQESLLWDIDLDYDPYESSKEVTIHSILNGNVYHDNQWKMDSFYEASSNDFLKARAQSVRDDLVRRLDRMDAFLKEISQEGETQK